MRPLPCFGCITQSPMAKPCSFVAGVGSASSSVANVRPRRAPPLRPRGRNADSAGHSSSLAPKPASSARLSSSRAPRSTSARNRDGCRLQPEPLSSPPQPLPAYCARSDAPVRISSFWARVMPT